MRFGGSGWKPASRRNRRQDGGPDRKTEKKADNTFAVILVVFVLVVLALVVAVGVIGPS